MVDEAANSTTVLFRGQQYVGRRSYVDGSLKSAQESKELVPLSSKQRLGGKPRKSVTSRRGRFLHRLSRGTPTRMNGDRWRRAEKFEDTSQIPISWRSRDTEYRPGMGIASFSSIARVAQKLNMLCCTEYLCQPNTLVHPGYPIQFRLIGF